MLFHLLVSSGCTTSVIYVRSSDQRSFVVSVFWVLLPSFFISVSESMLFDLQNENSSRSITGEKTIGYNTLREKMIYVDIGNKSARTKPTSYKKILKIRRLL